MFAKNIKEDSSKPTEAKLASSPAAAKTETSVSDGPISQQTMSDLRIAASDAISNTELRIAELSRPAKFGVIATSKDPTEVLEALKQIARPNSLDEAKNILSLLDTRKIPGTGFLGIGVSQELALNSRFREFEFVTEHLIVDIAKLAVEKLKGFPELKIPLIQLALKIDSKSILYSYPDDYGSQVAARALSAAFPENIKYTDYVLRSPTATTFRGRYGRQMRIHINSNKAKISIENSSETSQRIPELSRRENQKLQALLSYLQG